MQAEYFDAERPAHEVEEFFRSLNFFNRLFSFSAPFQSSLPKLLDGSACKSLTILDVGGGDGSLGRILRQWAKQREWDWKVTNLDASWLALRLNPAGTNVAASGVALPFRDASFDAVIASQMAHHLDDVAAEQLLRETWRVTRKALLVSDLHRSLFLYLAIWAISGLQRYSSSFRGDALLSVRRAWRAKDLRCLAARAGLTSCNIQVQFSARVILSARK